MSVPKLNDFVRLLHDDLDARLHAGAIGVVHGFSFYDGQWGAEVDFYPPDAGVAVHRFESLGDIKVVAEPMLDSPLQREMLR